MMHRRLPILAVLLALVLLPACGPSGDDSSDAEGAVADPAADRAAIAALLDDFLARTDEAAAHERFWAEDLVYSSSGGTRQGKADIIAGFATPAESSSEAEAADEEPGPTYSAEEVDIRLYDDMAVVAFNLMIHPPEGSGEPSSYNLNTGTLAKRDGEWRVVAWQSTRGAAPE